MKGPGLLPLTLSSSIEWTPFTSKKRKLPHANYANGRHSIKKGSYWRDVRKLQRFRNQPGWFQITADAAAVLVCYSIVSSSSFLLFIQFSCFSHSLSQHLLGLCKYCHCEILQALIDCGWGLIIRASYKDIFDKINATITEAKSLQWHVPLCFFLFFLLL